MIRNRLPFPRQTRPDADFCDERAKKTVHPRQPLSERTQLRPGELRVVESIARGNSNKEAGFELGLTHKTVGVYLNRAMHILHLRSRYDLMAWWMRTMGPPPGAGLPDRTLSRGPKG